MAHIPALSIKILLLPLALYFNWELLAPYLDAAQWLANPFRTLFALDGRIPQSLRINPLYHKTYWDFAFIAYYVVFFSFARRYITGSFSVHIARYFGLRTQAKIASFGEQVYVLLYYIVLGMGVCGTYIFMQIPWVYSPVRYYKGFSDGSIWDQSPGYPIGSPSWVVSGIQKGYCLIQLAHSCQELISLWLGRGQSRTHYTALVTRHLTTIVLLAGSYVANITHVGVAIRIGVDIPEFLLAICKMLHILQWKRSTTVLFRISAIAWMYSHCFHSAAVCSIWNKFKLIPTWTQLLSPQEGSSTLWREKWPVFAPLTVLLGLNLFWYQIILEDFKLDYITKDLSSSPPDDEREPYDGDRNNRSS